MRKALCLLAVLACQNSWAGSVVLKGCTVDFQWIGGTGPAQQICTVEFMASGNLRDTEPDGYVNFTGTRPELPAVVRMCGVDEACTTSGNGTAQRLKGIVTRTLALSGNPRYEIRFIAQLCADEGCQAAPAAGLGPATLFDIDVDVDTDVRSHGSRVKLGRTESLGVCGAGETGAECTARLLNESEAAAVGTAVTAVNTVASVVDGAEAELRRQLGCDPDEILEACALDVAQGAEGAAVGAAVETANFLLNYCDEGEIDAACLLRLANDTETAVLGAAVGAANDAFATAAPVVDGAKAEARRQLGCAPEESVEACAVRAEEDTSDAAMRGAVGAVNDVLNYCDEGEIDTDCLVGLANDTEAAVLGAGVNAVNTAFGTVAPFAEAAEAELRRQLGCQPEESLEACVVGAAQRAEDQAMGAAVGAVNDILTAAGLN